MEVDVQDREQVDSERESRGAREKGISQHCGRTPHKRMYTRFLTNHPRRCSKKKSSSDHHTSTLCEGFVSPRCNAPLSTGVQGISHSAVSKTWRMMTKDGGGEESREGVALSDTL